MEKIKNIWKKVNPYTNLMRLFDWLGPRGTLLLLCGIIWIQTGIGNLQGYSGSPQDAPHLLIPSLIRGSVWIICGGAAVLLAPTRSIKYHRLAITTLGIMPVLQMVSYWIAWLISWTVFQATFPNFPLHGSPKAEYSSTFWQSELLLVIVCMLAPATWKMVNTYIVRESEGSYDRTVKVVSEEDNNSTPPQKLNRKR